MLLFYKGQEKLFVYKINIYTILFLKKEKMKTSLYLIS